MRHGAPAVAPVAPGALPVCGTDGALRADSAKQTPRRKRFVAPGRESVDPRRFAAPIFATLPAPSHWLDGPDWPALDELNAALGDACHAYSGAPLRFVEQTPALLADGLHYEQRIHDRGEIATRCGNWHDLFNALVWIRRRELKSALNARQVADIVGVGPRARTRAQCALTHFDEGGAIVLLSEPQLLDAWDRHDWEALFRHASGAWSELRAQLLLFGHALLEHALQPDPLHSAKCLVLLAELGDVPTPEVACRALAAAIADGRLLLDPQDLRPLPLSGLPGWHPRSGEADFYREAPCFRPLRAGRTYPPPFRVTAA